MWRDGCGERAETARNRLFAVARRIEIVGEIVVVWGGDN